jgi:hypothetical protein
MLEVGNSSPQGIGFAHGEEFSEERHEAFAPDIDSFLVLVEPLFLLPHKGERKQTKPYSIRCDVFDDNCITQFKEGL